MALIFLSLIYIVALFFYFFSLFKFLKLVVKALKTYIDNNKKNS